MQQLPGQIPKQHQWKGKTSSLSQQTHLNKLVISNVLQRIIQTQVNGLVQDHALLFVCTASIHARFMNLGWGTNSAATIVCWACARSAKHQPHKPAAGPPSHVRDCLLLAGIDFEVTSALMDANDLHDMSPLVGQAAAQSSHQTKQPKIARLQLKVQHQMEWQHATTSCKEASANARESNLSHLHLVLINVLSRADEQASAGLNAVNGIGGGLPLLPSCQ